MDAPSSSHPCVGGGRTRWELQEAERRLGEVVRRALEDGPQVVAGDGEDVVVVISMDEYRRLRGRVLDVKGFLRAAPDLDALRIARSSERARTVDFDAGS